MKKLGNILGRGLQWLLLLACLAAAAPLLMTALARSPAMREYAKAQARLALRRELGLRAAIGDLDLEPHRLSLVARGITLTHPEEGLVVEAALLRIRPSWLALVRGTVDLNMVDVVQAKVRLKLRDGKIVNLPPLPESEGPSDEFPQLPLNYLTIQRSRLVLDAGPDGRAKAGQIDARIDASEPGNISVRLKVQDSEIRHPYGLDLVQRLEARGRLSEQGLEIEHVRLESPDVELLAERGFLATPLGEGRFEGELQAKVQLSQLDRLPVDAELPELDGMVQVSGHVSGVGDEELAGKGRVVLHDVHVDQFCLGDRVAIDVDATPDGADFKARFDAIDNGGRVDVDGRIDLKTLRLSTEARVIDVGFAKLMKQLGVSDNAIVDWLLAGRFDLSGTLDPLALRGKLHFDNKDFAITQDAYHVLPKQHILQLPSAVLDGGVRIDDAGIHLLDVDAVLPRSRLEVEHVLLGFDNALRVVARGAEVDLKDPSPLLDFELAGQGAFDVEVTGTFNDPQVGGSIVFKRFGFATFPFGDITADFRLEKGSQAVRFTDVHFAKNASRYSTESLWLDFSVGTLLVESDLDISRLDLSDFYHVFHYEQDDRWRPYQGQVQGTAKVRYTLGFPQDTAAGTMTTLIALDIPKAELDGYAFEDGRFEGSWNWVDHREGFRGGDLIIDGLSLRKGDGTANISGSMRKGELNLVVLGDRIAAKDTEGLGDRLDGLSGTYSLSGTVRGDAAAPRADLDLDGYGLRYRGVPLGRTRAYVRLTDKDDPWIAAALEWPHGSPPAAEACGHGRQGLARGQWPEDPPIFTSDGWEPALDRPMAWVLCGTALDGAVTLDLAVGRTKIMPLRGRVTLDDLDFGRLLPTGPDGRGAEGRASGHMQLVDGAALEPSGLGGELRLSRLSAGQMAVQIQNSSPVHVRFGQGSLDVVNAQFIGPDSMLYIRGGGSVERGLSLVVDGNIDLGLLTGLSSTIRDAAGRVDLRFRVSGRVDRPAIHGDALVRDAALRVASLPTPIDNVQGRVVFSEQRILLEDFRAGLAGGQLRFGGSANLEGRELGNYRVEFAARDMSLSPQDGVELRFGGHTQLAWQRGDRLPKLTGTLQLDGARYERDVQMGQSLQDMYKKRRAHVKTYDPGADALAFDLRLQESEPLRVVNNMIDAQLALDTTQQPFRIVGTDQRFGLVGNMSIRRGILRYRDTTFDIREGEFRFADPTRINPSFDIRAVTDVRRNRQLGQETWHITMHAYGTTDEFRFELRSDPNLSEDDIALLLTLGMTHAELAQLETGDLTGTAALEALATVTGVEREVQRVLPTVDDFRVQSAYSQRSNRTEPQLYIGKRIADRVRLSAATGVGESRDFRTGVELQVTDQTSVQAVYDNQNATSASQVGDVGVDLKWRLEFD